jgi:hypothetical protein
MSVFDSLLSSSAGSAGVRASLRQSPAYVINRNRVGALLHDGFSAMDTYESIKPALFIGSLLGMAGSGYGLVKRKGAEAKALYGILFALSAVTAFVTRPGGSSPADATPEDVEAAPQDAATVGWIDRRVAALEAQDPNFADAAFQRLVQMPGIKTQFVQLPAAIQAAVV